MNSILLRKLIHKHGDLGYLLVGVYLLGYWLFRFKRKQTIAVLALTLMGASLGGWVNARRISSSQGAPLGEIGPYAYTVTDLGVVPGYAYSFGEKVNNKGQATGDIADEEFEKLHGFFASNGKMTDIGSLGGDLSLALGINDAGQVVGTSITGSDDIRGFVWQNGKMNKIGTLGGQFSFAEGINNKGQAVGISDTARQQLHAFLWQDGKMTDIGAKCPGQFNGATAINDNGDVAGVFTEDGETIQSFVLSGNKSKPLPTIGGDFTIATAISKAHIVGLGTIKKGDDADTVHGFVYQPNGIQDIGTLGGQNSFASGVNSSGQVVGGAEGKDGLLRAILWQGGKTVDLNTLIPSNSGWQLFVAAGINEKGQIIGTGLVKGNAVHAFLLTPK